MKQVLLALALVLGPAAFADDAAPTTDGAAKTTEHKVHENHPHKHGKKCGHKSAKHGDHSDFEHDGHKHRAHEGHQDECDGTAKS